MSKFDRNKQTIEQYDGDCTCDPTSLGYATCEFCHDRNVIGKLRRENERLRELLRNVVESKCKGFFTSESYDNPRSGRTSDYKVVGKFKQLADAQDFYRQLIMLTKELSDE